MLFRSSWRNIAQAGYEDVSDIADTIDDTYVEDTVAETPAGGLSAVSAADTTSTADTVSAATAPVVTTQEEAATNVGAPAGLQALQATDEEKPADIAGGLNTASDAASKALTGAGTAVAGAVASGLKGALKQGITQSVRGALTKPVLKTPVKRVPVKTATPTKLSPTQLASLTKTPTKVDVSKLKPVVSTTTAPKKVDVKTLTPVQNIAGLTALLGKKG